MRLESEGGHAYLSMLLQLSSSQTDAQQQADIEARLVDLGLATLQRFQVGQSTWSCCCAVLLGICGETRRHSIGDVVAEFD